MQMQNMHPTTAPRPSYRIVSAALFNAGRGGDMYVLTRRFNAPPAGGRCVKLVGGVAVALGGRCAGRYLVVKRGAGVYASAKPLQTLETPIYVAAGAPRRYLFTAGAAKVEDGLDLFHGFRKRGLRQEVAPAFYAAVSAYAARCGYCTAYVEAELRQAPRYPAKPTRWWRWRNTAESTKQSW